VQLAPADDYAVKTGGMPPALLVLDPEVPVLVCDLDETVTTGGSWRLLLSHADLEPMPGAAQVLSQLTRSHQIIFLTARDDTLLNESRDWLARRGFPRSPVVGRDWSPGNLSRAGDFKERLLVAWKKRFPHIALGIGNSQGDCQAYRAAGIPHFMIGTSYCPEPDAVECMVVDNWADISARLAERAAEKPPLEKSLKNKRAKEND
jgi:phosphoglycolate phosphatase-like HAD superfamily hydrolase